MRDRLRVLPWILGVGFCLTLDALGTGRSFAYGSAIELLKAARAAIGGETDLAAIKTLVIKGRHRDLNLLYGQIPGADEQFTAGQVEIRALLPDHYLRVDTIVFTSGRSSQPNRRGFAGANGLPSGNGAFQRAQFARLMLLLFLRTDTSLPITLQAAPSTDTLEFLDAQGTHYLVDLDRITRRPIRLRVNVRKIDSDGLPTGETVGEVVETIVARREVGRLSVPDHITTTKAGELYQEEWYQFIQMNTPLSPQDFRS